MSSHAEWRFSFSYKIIFKTLGIGVLNGVPWIIENQ